MNPTLPTFQEIGRQSEKYPRCAMLSALQICGIPFLVLATDEQLSVQEAELEKRAIEEVNNPASGRNIRRFSARARVT